MRVYFAVKGRGTFGGRFPVLTLTPGVPTSSTHPQRAVAICIASMYKFYARFVTDYAADRFRSRVPVYEQIANGLRAELVSRKFSPGLGAHQSLGEG